MVTIPPIIPLSNQPGVRFAAAELRRYLRQATGTDPQVLPRKRYRSDFPALWLGLFSQFPEAQRAGLSDSPEVDRYHLQIGPEGGILAASNSRSVLLGAYRYLTELGFRWVRPGRDGELIPSLSLPLPAVHLCDQGSYRHRGVCIEGAVSERHVRDMVDWLPKLGFNGYFIQFREAYNFFQRWYEHTGNPTFRKRTFTLEEARTLTRKLRREIKRRDLDLHMVGHGWTCEPFGIPGTGWYPHEGPLPEGVRPFLAEVQGKRELWGGIALNTNLCYGNPEVRRILTEAIVEWARENPDVDIIHFWLADGSNNHCECPLCRDHLPSDLYVQMLNQLDQQLTAAGLGVRIVFLIYVDLLWPPQREKIHHPDRFILMFAPITRSYSQPFAGKGGALPEIPPYQRNRLTFPRDPQQNLAFLRRWQEMFSGDSFDFDYHFMWDHFKDPGYYAMAQVLHQDVVRLRDLGLNGFMSCQVQRAFFPTGLGMTVLGRTLWDRELGFEAIADDYFRSAFGEEGEAARRYCQQISELFNPRLLRGEADAAEQQAAPSRLAQVPLAVAAVKPALERGLASPQPCHAASWRYLQKHTELVLLLAEALAAKWQGRADEARARGWKVLDWARRNERELQSVFDLFEFQLTLGPLLGISGDELTSGP